MNIPKELKYTEEHEWIKTDGEHAYIGITDYAQGELGDIVFVEVETVGETMDKGETFGTIEAVKTVSDMFMPVSGEIVELNSIIEEAPEKINQDPYGEGWIIKVKFSDQSEIDALMSAEKYESMINS